MMNGLSSPKNMINRPLTSRNGSKKLLTGLAALVAVGLVSAYLYYSRSTSQWAWGSHQTDNAGHVKFGLAEQNRLIEAIYQETQALQNEELARVKPTDFVDGLAIVGPNNQWRLKYIWDYFLPAYNCPLKEKVGIDRALGDNGKWLCGVRTWLQREGCIVYSFGSNGETTFEQDILRKTKCKVHVFDPTLAPDVMVQVSSIPGVTLHNYGLGPVDGVVNLTDPRQTMSKGYASFPVKSLATIMRELRHPWVDVLKIDIEGAEWPVLKELVASKKQFPCTQMQVEFHYFSNSNITKPREMLDVLKGIMNRDMRVFNAEPNYWWHNWGYEFIEFAYLQVGKDGQVVTGPEASKTRKLVGAPGTD